MPRATAAPTPLALSAADHVLVTTLLGTDEAVATIATLSRRGARALHGPLAAPSPTPTDGETLGRRDPHSTRSPSCSTVHLPGPSGRSIRSPTSPCSSTGAVAGAPPVVIADARLGARAGRRARRAAGRARRARRRRSPACSCRSALEPAAVAAAVAEYAELPGVDDVLYLEGDTGVIAAAVIAGGRAAAWARTGSPRSFGAPAGRAGRRALRVRAARMPRHGRRPEIVLERAGLDAFAADARPARPRSRSSSPGSPQPTTARAGRGSTPHSGSAARCSSWCRPSTPPSSSSAGTGRARRRHRDRLPLEPPDDRRRGARGDPEHHRRAGRAPTPALVGARRQARERLVVRAAAARRLSAARLDAQSGNDPPPRGACTTHERDRRRPPHAAGFDDAERQHRRRAASACTGACSSSATASCLPARRARRGPRHPLPLRRDRRRGSCAAAATTRSRCRPATSCCCRTAASSTCTPNGETRLLSGSLALERRRRHLDPRLMPAVLFTCGFRVHEPIFASLLETMHREASATAPAAAR